MTDACTQFIAELREIAEESQFEFSQNAWEDSKGANIEARLAINLGMRVVEIETLLAEAE